MKHTTLIHYKYFEVVFQSINSLKRQHIYPSFLYFIYILHICGDSVFLSPCPPQEIANVLLFCKPRCSCENKGQLYLKMTQAPLIKFALIFDFLKTLLFHCDKCLIDTRWLLPLSNCKIQLPSRFLMLILYWLFNLSYYFQGNEEVWSLWQKFHDWYISH